MNLKQIALYGGTFDPIHQGHTTVALAAALSLGVDKLVFIPAKQSPLKTHSPHASDTMRLDMIRLAIANQPLFMLDTCELTRSTPSYTLDTVLHFREKYGEQTKLYWLMGADGVTGLARWHCIHQLLEACTIVTMVRGGCAAPDFSVLLASLGADQVKKLQEQVLQTPDVPISSTEVRRRLKNNLAVDDLLHPQVLQLIQRENLYR